MAHYWAMAHRLKTSVLTIYYTLEKHEIFYFYCSYLCALLCSFPIHVFLTLTGQVVDITLLFSTQL